MEDSFQDALCRPIRKLKVLAELFDGVGSGDDLCILLELLTKEDHSISYGIAEHLEDIANEISEIGDAFSHVWTDGVQKTEALDQTTIADET